VPGCAHGPDPGGGAGAGAAVEVEPAAGGSFRSSEIGWEKTNRFGEGSTGGVGGPTSCQRRRKYMI
jgi:hypothetical protein